jgi:hypothetical protein
MLDPEGLELADLKAVKKAVLEGARDVLSNDLKSGGVLDLRYRIDAENADGEIAHTLRFQDAVQIIPEAA